MLSGYSSIDFMKNGKYLISRDMMTVKIWDICNTKKPVSTVVVHESLKSKLCEMFENDCMDDKFNISASPDGNTILTGNYNNSFHLIDVADSTNTQYELSYKKQTVSKVLVPGKCSPISKMDYLRKTTASDFNTKKNMLAVASLNCFYIYSM
jgi:serine/threonine-protein phosphatase 2A regulatory subunit B